MKFFTYLSSVLTLCLLGIFSAHADVAPPKTLYAFMNNRAAWSENGNMEPYYGIYAFAPDGSTGFTAISPTGINNDWACTAEGGGGGVYEDGYYYCFTLYGDWRTYQVQYNKVDTRTWKTTSKNTISSVNGECKLVPVDVTANPADGKLYAICDPKVNNSDNTTLCEVNRETGVLTPLFTTRHFGAIASDAKGQLYALTTPDYGFGELFKIDLANQTTELVGRTNLSFIGKPQSATIDFRSGKMYLSHFGRWVENGEINYNYSVQGLYEINLETGESTLCHMYGDYEDLSALSAPNSHPAAPDMLTDLTFTPTGVAELRGVVKFTTPTITFGQTPLSGEVEVNISIDGGEAVIAKTTAGAVFSQEFDVEGDGMHTVAVKLAADGHLGEANTATNFFGNDTPSNITNLKLTASADLMTATVTWDAPTGAAHGGAYEPDKVRYQIVRMPGNVTVARSAKETTFTEEIPHSYASTYYKVTPYIEGDTNKRGATSNSNAINMGSAWSLPYVEPFNPGCWSAYTVIDANGDGGAWDWEDPVWKYDDIYYCAFFYHFYLAGPSDDWLITPKMAFEEGKLYRMTFQAYGYYTTNTNDFEVAFGNAPTVDGMHTVLGHQTLNGTTINDRAQISYIFAPRAGDQFVGFHNLTEVPNHLSIDNLLIEEIGVSSVPAAVNNLKASIVDRSGIVDLSFDAPILDAAGIALKGNMDIALYRGDAATPFKTLKDVKPGEHVAYTDNEAYPALNIYRVVTSNADGEGLSESVSIDLRAGTPQPVTEVKASLVNSNQVSLTWEAPTASTDENGNEIDTKNIRYNVYRPSIYGDLDVIGRSISDCFFLDNDPNFMSGDNQATMVYYVTAVNGDGESAQTASNVVTIGDTYKLPFAETWANGANATSPWLQSNATAGWTITSQGYNPMTPGQDGFGILSMELGVGGEEYDLLDQSTGIMWSPRVDLSNVKDATLTFYLFGQNTYHVNDCMTIYLDIEGVGQKELGKFQPRTFAGWKKCELDLTPYVGYDRVSVVLYGVINRKPTDTEAPRMHIDNFSITGTPVEKEVKLSAIAGPGEIRSEVPSVYKVSVTNLGISDAQNVPVTLYADNEQVAKQTVDIIKAGETKVVEFEYTPAGASDDLVEVLAEITYNDAYDNVNNNNTMTMLVKVLPINLPYVTDLNGIYYQDNQEAVLSWSYPSVADEFETVIDGAEAYDAFAINDFGCWTVNDVDGVLPFKFSDPTTEKPLAWDNNDQPQAWMVFNPSNVTSDRTFYPYTGAQVFTSFAAATPNGNDDWLISPELSGEAQLISFVVRRLNERDASEKYNVLYSTTDTNPESFRRLNGANPLYAPFEWEVKNFALPEGAKYFAIQYVGVMQSAMMVDDLQFEGYPTHVRPDGYRIYRDGKLLNSSLTSRTSFTDSNVADGVYTYEVRPVYNGIEAPTSNIFTLDTSGVGTIGSQEVVSVMTSNGYIHVMNAQGKHVRVVSIDGKVQASRAINGNREAIAMAPGIYVVSIEGKNFKVIVR